MNDRQRPLVSIAIPTYNRADKFFLQALESAVSQTYPNIEILVSDNASTDDTESLVNSFSDPRIRYHKHEKNIGAINNFNACVKLSKGDFFVLLHDDDLLDPDFVACCIKAVENQPRAGVVFTGVRAVDVYGKVISECKNRGHGLSTPEFILGWFANLFPLYMCNTLFSTQALREIGEFHSKTNLYPDVVAQVQVVYKYGYTTVQDVKASFRQHPVSLGGTPDRLRDWQVDSLYLLDIMGQLTPPERRSEIMEEGLRYFSRVNYDYADSLDSISQRWKMYKETHKAFKCSYSPISYLWERELGRLRRAPGKVRQLIHKNRS